MDVAIIGAGIAGCAVARELSRLSLDVVVLEAGYDVACGASRSNSGIVHGGYDPVPGTRKALYNARGMRMIPGLADELGFRYSNNGSLVIALSDQDLPAIDVLVGRARANGIEGVRRIGTDELHGLEPNVNPCAVGALLCEGSGICDPFGMTVAFAENAAANGVTFRMGTRVVGASRRGGLWDVALADGSHVEATLVVNAAGVHAIDLHNQVSSDRLASRPRLGEYVLMSRDMHGAFGHTIFRAPGPKGKGVLVSPTADGNLIVGPDAVDGIGPDDTATTPSGLEWVIEQARLTWPAFDPREIIVNFAGTRPCGADGDFVIGEPADAPGFFDIAAFDSPGITSAPAVAVDVAAWAAERLGARPDPAFDGHRDMPPRFLEMGEAEREEAIARDPAFSHLVCRCEQVSEAEVLAAIHAPIPATTVNAVKRRCRAGMGRCQGGFCEPLVVEMLSRELGIPIQDVLLGEPGSEIAPLTRGEGRS
jgi:glycerol-3-phosphate dehydrogenase